VDAGISNHSVLLANVFVPVALQRGNGFKLGEGKNIWGNIEINERRFQSLSEAFLAYPLILFLVVDLYSRVFDAVLKDPENTPNGREGFYFASSDEHNLIEVYNILAEVLYEQGKGESSEPTPFGKDEADRFFGVGDVLHFYHSPFLTSLHRVRMLSIICLRIRDVLVTVRRGWVGNLKRQRRISWTLSERK
jgi:hypothetical protein